MNRNQRRAAQKSHTSSAGISLQDIAQQALAAQAQGDLVTAQRLVEKLYAAEPNNPDVIHFMGVLALGQQHFTKAESYVKQALRIREEEQYWRTLVQIHTAQAHKDKAKHAVQKFLSLIPADNIAGIEEAANLLLNNGNYAEAVTQYQHVLSSLPSAWGILFNIGQCYEQLGQSTEAETYYTKAFAQHQSFAPLLQKVAYYAMQRGDMKHAEHLYQQCLDQHPDNATLWIAIVDFYRHQQDFTQAEAYLVKASAMLPHNADVHFHYACFLTTQQRWGEAIEKYRSAVMLNPSNTAYYVRQAENFRHVRFLCYDEAAEQDLIRLFAWQQINHQHLVPVTLSLLEHIPLLQELLTLATEDETAFISCLCQPTYQAVIQYPLLLMVLQTAFFVSLKWEKLFTLLRQHVFLSAAQDNFSCKQLSISLDCLVALSHQCYLNEYIYNQTLAEDSALNALTHQLESQKSPTIAAALMLSCYMPLSRLKNRDAIEKAGIKSSISIQGLLKRHITDPKHEWILRRQMPVLTPIENDVSKAVRAQYEENPYPRWDAIHKIEAASPAAHIRSVAPFLTPQDFNFDDKVSILIAGCGTGQHVAYTAQEYKNSDVLAVDLSLASLCYAKRKITEMGLNNVTFAQADILQLEALNNQFDIIESAGVLHHLEDPMRGWQVLRRLLKPQGYMCIALYSTKARSAIKQAREMIAEKGFANTPAGMRACRQEIIANGDTLFDAYPLQDFPDFYSLSMCRDLLFHVQEHTFTIPQIAAALEELNLEFIAFILPEASDTKMLYRQMFPEDTTLQNLNNWELFEQAHPTTFAAMYQMMLRAKS